MEESPESLLRIVTQVDDPRLRLCLDVGHVNCYSSVPASQWMAQWGDALSHLHLHNNDASTDSHGGLSRGSLPMVELIRGIAPHMTATLELIEIGDSVHWLKGKCLL